MPVRWLYVQRDGSISAAVGADPVGRIAFWADDETCKVNINTASEGGALNTIGGANVGVFDIIRDDTWSTNTNSRKVPLAGEFNMQPGHPAQVSLSSVFGQIGTPPTPFQMMQAYTENSLATNWGGSQGAGVVTFRDGSASDNAGEILVPSVPLKDDPLAADVSEWIFGNNDTVSNGIRSRSNSLAASNASPQDLGQAGFLATTRNPASTLNLFGTPRVSIWPLAATAANRSKYDKRMALASDRRAVCFTSRA
jgi:hypothetical protein